MSIPTLCAPRCSKSVHVSNLPRVWPKAKLCQVCWLVGLLADRMIGWLVCWVVVWLVWCLIVWSMVVSFVRCSFGLIGWFGDELVGCFVGWFLDGLDAYLFACGAGRLVAYLLACGVLALLLVACSFANSLFDWCSVRSVGCLLGWLFDWMVGWLTSWCSGQLVSRFIVWCVCWLHA